jgi:hypothetical protein
MVIHLGTFSTNRPLACALQQALTTDYRKQDGRVMVEQTVQLPVGLRVEPTLRDGHTNLPTTDGLYIQKACSQAAYRTDGVYMQCFLMVSQNDNRTPVLHPRPRTIPGSGTPHAGGGNATRRNVRPRPSNISTVGTDSDDESNRAYFSPTHASPTGALALRNI